MFKTGLDFNHRQELRRQMGIKNRPAPSAHAEEPVHHATTLAEDKTAAALRLLGMGRKHGQP